MLTDNMETNYPVNTPILASEMQIIALHGNASPFQIGLRGSIHHIKTNTAF